jgi:hypothetical protein
MPTHQRLWLEDDCGIEQGGEQPVKPDEDQPVGVPQFEPCRRRASQDEQLLPQKENLRITRDA